MFGYSNRLLFITGVLPERSIFTVLFGRRRQILSFRIRRWYVFEHVYVSASVMIIVFARRNGRIIMAVGDERNAENTRHRLNCVILTNTRRSMVRGVTYTGMCARYYGLGGCEKRIAPYIFYIYIRRAFFVFLRIFIVWRKTPIRIIPIIIISFDSALRTVVVGT